MVDREPRRDCREVSLRQLDLGLERGAPAAEQRVLDDVLRVTNASDHPVGDREEHGLSSSCDISRLLDPFGSENCLRARANTELGVDVAQMSLHRYFADIQSVCDLSVGVTAREQCEDITLPM
jgi:hypothetical protein